MPDTSKPIRKKTDSNIKITEVEIKICSISGLSTTTTTALNAVENKLEKMLLKKIPVDKCQQSSQENRLWWKNVS